MNNLEFFTVCTDTQTSKKGKIKFFPHYNEIIPKDCFIRLTGISISFSDVKEAWKARKATIKIYINSMVAELVPAGMFGDFAEIKLGHCIVASGNSLSIHACDLGKHRKTIVKLTLRGYVSRPPKGWVT